MARSPALLSFAWGENSLVPALVNLPPEAAAAVAAVIRTTTDRAFRIAKNKTPVDRGDARNGWRQVASGQKGRIFNNVPYINVLEFGGYPVTPASRTRRSGLRRGKAILGGAPPPNTRDSSGRFQGGARTQKARSSGRAPMRSNVSKQAPVGMVRSTLEELRPRFLSDLTHAINSLPSWSS